MLERISYDPIHRPIIKGSGMSVQTVLEFLLQEMTVSDIVRRYPRLTREDVLAAIHFAINNISAQKNNFRPIEPAPAAILPQELLRIGQQCAALPRFDTRSAEDILGYNDIGVPT